VLWIILLKFDILELCLAFHSWGGGSSTFLRGSSRELLNVISLVAKIGSVEDFSVSPMRLSDCFLAPSPSYDQVHKSNWVLKGHKGT
jgi:hypothetical protein